MPMLQSFAQKLMTCKWMFFCANHYNYHHICSNSEKLALHSVINLTSEPTNLGFGRGGVRTLFISTKDDLFQCAIYQSSFKKTLLDSRGCRLNMGGVNVNGCFYMYSDGGIYRYKSTTERQDSDSIKLVNKVVYANPRIFMCFSSIYTLAVNRSKYCTMRWLTSV